MMRPLVLVAMAWCCWSNVQGAELVIRDLQADIELPPTKYSFQLNTPGGNRTGNDGFSSGSALTLGGRYSVSRPGDAFGLVAGVDLELAGYTDSYSDLLDVGGRASLGAGYAVSDDWVLTLSAGYALGEGKYSANASNGAPQVDVHGPYHGEDVRLDVLYHVTRSIGVTAGGGYWRDVHKLSGSGSSLQLQRSGLVVGIGVTWRFFSAPVRLE
jgi:hypothetical protein